MTGLLRCYVCGLIVRPKGLFACVSLSKDTDRVFIVHTGRCLDVIDKKDRLVEIVATEVT